MKITTAWLRERYACDLQVKIFAAIWPAGAEITLNHLRIAEQNQLDLRWLARKILPATALRRFNVAAQARYAAGTKAAVATAFWPEWCRIRPRKLIRKVDDSKDVKKHHRRKKCENF